MSGALGRRGKRLTDHHHRLSVVKSAAVCSSFVQDIRVDKPADVAAAWDVALGADRSTLLEMVTDPNVPPAPPHVSAKQVPRDRQDRRARMVERPEGR